MIETEADFNMRVQSCIAPIYFFEENGGQLKDTERFTTNGTLTLFQKDVNIFGITNYHVYKRGYLDRKQNNENVICQIGHKLRINLEQRIFYEDEKQDLIIFFLFAITRDSDRSSILANPTSLINSKNAAILELCTLD